MRRGICSFLLAFAVWSPIAAQTLDIDQAVALIMQESQVIKSAEEALEKAEEALQSTLLIERSRISFSSSLRTKPLKPGETFWDLITGSMQLSVPVVPQVSMGAGLDDKGGSISLSYTPFSLPQVTPKDTETYQKAVISLQTAVAEAGFRAESTLFSYMTAQRDLAYAEQVLELAQQQLEITHALYDMGEATYTDYEAMTFVVSSRRQNWFSSQRTLLERTRDVKSILGPDFPVFTITQLSLAELTARAYERREEADRINGSSLHSSAVDRLLVEINSLEEQLRQTWAWRPNLSLRSSVSFPDPSLSIQASVSFSYTDLQTSVKEELERAITEKQADLAMEHYLLELEQELRYKSMEIARQSLEASLFDLEQARIQVKEAELLFSFGDRTEIELAQVHLSSVNAENQCYRQAAAYLRSINDYLLLYRLQPNL